MNIYVGNLPLDVSEDEVRRTFKPYGRIASVNIIKDKLSDRPLGFGFVEMPERKQAQEAINALNRKKIKGRVVMVGETGARIERRGSVGKK